MCSGFERSLEVYSPGLFNERSMQLGLSGMAAELETGWNFVDQITMWQVQQRASKRSTEGLDSKSTVPLVLVITESWERGKSFQLDHISHLLCVNVFEQTHRGDHFIFEHPSNASSWNEQCIQKLIAQPSVFRIDKPMCRWHLLSGESGLAKELTSWLTNHPDLAYALEQWRESVSGVDASQARASATRIGISSVSCGFGGVFPESHSGSPSR